MTFLASPLAVDGARLTSGLVRKGIYAGNGGSEGLVERIDLKVSQLATPGQGLLISAGNAVVLNRYQSVINEAYIAANPDVHTVLASQMPTSQPSAKSYLVLVTIGDQEFSQVGHPWMPAERLDPVDAVTYQYVRPFIVECPAGTTSFSQLNLNYPAYALARLDVPAGQTTITNAMITDLRKMARPRTEEAWFVTNSSIADGISTAEPFFEQWPNVAYHVDIPRWASVAKMIVTYEGIVITPGAINGHAKIRLGAVGDTPLTTINRTGPASGSDRTGLTISGKVDIAPQYAGTGQDVYVMAGLTSSSYANRLATDAATSITVRVRFEEAPA
jgi:hypothetical protein